MTAIADAKTVVETLIGRTATTEELQRIAAAFVDARTYGVRIPTVQPDTVFVDSENPTNEEKAQLFLDAMKWFARQVVANAAEKTTRAQNDANVAAAKATAEADLT